MIIRELFTTGLVNMHREGLVPDESSARIIPTELLEAVDAGATVSLESVERKLIQNAVAAGDEVRAQSKYLQEVEKVVLQEVVKSKR